MLETRVDQLVYDFNCRPISYVDTSWLDGPCARAVRRLRTSGDPQARSLINQWLAKHLDIDSAFDFEFTQPAKRLMLLDACALRELSLAIGAWSTAHMLRKWVDRKRRAALHEALGQTAADFFYRHSLRWQGRMRVALPEQDSQNLAPAELRARLQQLGAALLLSSAGPREHPAVRRTAFKLHKRVGHAERRFSLSEEHSKRVSDFAVGCVVRHQETQWHWLF